MSPRHRRLEKKNTLYSVFICVCGLLFVGMFAPRVKDEASVAVKTTSDGNGMTMAPMSNESFTKAMAHKELYPVPDITNHKIVVRWFLFFAIVPGT